MRIRYGVNHQEHQTLLIRYVVILTFLSLLTACGGGSNTTINPAPPPPANTAPVVDAGADATIRLPTDTVSLAGAVAHLSQMRRTVQWWGLPT